jgi:hypothetical protein
LKQTNLNATLRRNKIRRGRGREKFSSDNRESTPETRRFIASSSAFESSIEPSNQIKRERLFMNSRSLLIGIPIQFCPFAKKNPEKRTNKSRIF